MSDIYNLTYFDLLSLDLFANKKADNLLTSVDESKKRPLDKFIYALGITRIGAKTAEVLASEFGSIESLQKASVEDLQKIPEIGPIVAQSVFDFFSSPEVQDEIKKFKLAGLTFTPARRKTGGPLAGKTFVFTGELKTLQRPQAEALAKENGAKVAGSVSSKTFAVVAGEEAGGKLTTARKLGVRVLSEEDFLQLVKK